MIAPPLEIILVPELIKEAWYPGRLVPWSSGFLQWETYLEYLDNFLKLNCGSLNLDLAIDQCQRSEEFVMCASVLSDEERSLSGNIMSSIEEIKKQKHCMSKEKSCLAAAGFEANMMMSGLNRDNSSNVIRRRALNLMASKGPRCATVSAALLGLAMEAKLMLDFLKQDEADNPHLQIEVSTCWTVRTRTLTFLTNLQTSFALHIDGNHDRGVASSTEKSTRDNAVENSLRKSMGVDKSDANHEIMSVPCAKKENNGLKDDASVGDKHLGKKTDERKLYGCQEPWCNQSDKAIEEDYEVVLEDKVMEEAKEKKNALHACVRDLRNNFYEIYYDLVTLEDRRTLLTNLQEVEEWLYKDGADATEEVYVAKLVELKKVGGAIETRYKEWDGGSALAELVYCIHNCKEAALSSDPKFDHIGISDKQNVVNECTAVEAWLISLLKPVNPSDFKAKAEALDRFCNTVMNAKASSTRGSNTGAETSEPAYEGGAPEQPAAEQMDSKT